GRIEHDGQVPALDVVRGGGEGDARAAGARGLHGQVRGEAQHGRRLVDPYHHVVGRLLVARSIDGVDVQRADALLGDGDVGGVARDHVRPAGRSRQAVVDLLDARAGAGGGGSDDDRRGV